MRRPYKHIDLGDKFAEFEHTPDDSNWNSISGGINSRQKPGGLADKFSKLEFQPDKKVWAGVMAGAGIEKKSRRGAFWFTSGVAASLAVLAVWSLAFSDNPLSTAYTPREAGTAENRNLTEELDQKQNNVGKKHTDRNVTDQSGLASYVEDNEKSSLKPRNSDLLNSSETTDKQLNKMNPQTHLADKNKLHLSVQNGGEWNIAEKNSPFDKNIEKNLEDSGIAMTLVDSNSNFKEDTLVKFTIEKPSYDLALQVLNLKGLESLTLAYLDKPEPKGKTKSQWLDEVQPLLAPPREANTNSLLASSQLNQTMVANSSSLSWTNDGDFALVPDQPEELISINNNSGTLVQYGPEEFSTPVYITLNFEKRLRTGRKNRLSLGSGLGVLIMKSTQSANFQVITTNVNISRTYGVVPVYVKYDIIKKQKWNLYFSTGGALELGLGGNRVIKDTENGTEINSNTSKFNLGLGQINVNSGLGGSVNLGRYFSLFTEVSVSHYVYESQYNFWSNQTLWPSLKTGIIFKL